MGTFNLHVARQWADESLCYLKDSAPSQYLIRSRSVGLYGIIAMSLILWLFYRAVKLLGRPKLRRPSTPDLEKLALRRRSSKLAERQSGVWMPVDFKRPTATPAANWSVHTAKPLPYRPFRHGPYHITMGLRNMKWDDWIEIDNTYPKFHADKAARILERGSKCSRTDPSAFDGACELLEELCSYLPERYPSMFVRTSDGMDNLLTGEKFNIIERPLAEDPMQIAGRMVQDDLVIMFEKEDGQYYLLAASILLAGSWKLEEKWGMPLGEIHTSGNVPGFKTKLEKGMMNFFRRVQPSGPVIRHNYTIQVDDCLAWSTSLGPEDGQVPWSPASKNKAISHHHFRSELQTLRRLPRSGGVVFTIRTYFHPITEICEEPYVPGRLASAIRSWGDDVAKYKAREMYEEVLLEYLDRKHREQVEAGLDLAKEDENRSYPF